MTRRESHLRIVESNPWNDPRSYRPDLIEALRRAERDTRLRQLRLEVHPRINWLHVAVGVIVVYVLLVAAMVLL